MEDRCGLDFDISLKEDSFFIIETFLTEGQEFSAKELEAYRKMSITFSELLNPVIRVEWEENEKKLKIYEAESGCKSLKDLFSADEGKEYLLPEAVKQINEILSALHVHQICHLNLYPENVLVQEDPVFRVFLSNKKAFYSAEEKSLEYENKKTADYLQFGFLLLDVLGYKIKRPHDISELLEWISKRVIRLQSEITTAFKPLISGILSSSPEKSWREAEIMKWSENIQIKKDKVIPRIRIKNIEFSSFHEIAGYFLSSFENWEESQASFTPEKIKEIAALFGYGMEKRFLETLAERYADDPDLILHKFCSEFSVAKGFKIFGRILTLQSLKAFLENPTGVKSDPYGRKVLESIASGKLSVYASIVAGKAGEDYEMFQIIKTAEKEYRASGSSDKFKKTVKCLSILTSREKYLIPEKLLTKDKSGFFGLLREKITDIPEKEGFTNFSEEYLLPDRISRIESIKSMDEFEFPEFLDFFISYKKNPVSRDEYDRIKTKYIIPTYFIDIEKSSLEEFSQKTEKLKYMVAEDLFFTEAQFRRSCYKGSDPEEIKRKPLSEFISVSSRIKLGITDSFFSRVRRIKKKVNAYILYSDPLSGELDFVFERFLNDPESFTKEEIKAMSGISSHFTFFPFAETFIYAFKKFFYPVFFWFMISGAAGGAAVSSVMNWKNWITMALVFFGIAAIFFIYLPEKKRTFEEILPALKWPVPIGLVGASVISTIIYPNWFFIFFIPGILCGMPVSSVYTAVKTRKQGFCLRFKGTRETLNLYLGKIRH